VAKIDKSGDVSKMTMHGRSCLNRFLSLLACFLSVGSFAQRVDNSVSLFGQVGTPASGPPLTLTLQDALQRSKANNPQFQAALTDFGLAKEDRVQSRAALLPNVNYDMEYLYTQGNGLQANQPIFIANNAVHEYISQGNVHQEFSPRVFAEYRRTGAAQALAQARAEVAARGLVVTVVQAYYGHVVAQRKYATAQQAVSEAQRFLEISQKLEKGGEVANSDVLKAQIQYQQRQRDLQEAQLEMSKTHLDLAVLLFADFNENFTVVDDLRLPAPVPTYQEVQAAATQKNPDIRAAIAALKEASGEVAVAWAGLLPAVTADYFYGLDATRFATRIDGFSTLGSSGAVGLQLPIWTWGANRSRIKQANLRRNLARVELSFAQRTLLANLRSFYQELQAARSELELLGQSADAAAESLRLTTLRYQAGESTVLEVVDAQNTLTSARNAYDDGQVRYRVAQANLQTLTGTL
jgi:outer membrane protein TolC